MPSAAESPDSYTLLGALFSAFVDSNDPGSGAGYAPNTPVPWNNPIGEAGTAVANFLTEAAHYELIKNPIEIAKQQINAKAINPLPAKLQKFGYVDEVTITSKRFGEVKVGGSRGAGAIKVDLWTASKGASALTQIEGILKGRTKAKIIKGAAPVLSWMVGSSRVARSGAAALIAQRTIKRLDIVGFVAKTSAFVRRASGKGKAITQTEEDNFLAKGVALHIEAALRNAGLSRQLAIKLSRNKALEREFLQLVHAGKIKLDDPRSFRVYVRWTLRRVSRQLNLTDAERARIRQVTGERSFRNFVQRGRRAARAFKNDKDAAKFAARSIGALGVVDPRYSKLAEYVDRIEPRTKSEEFFADAAAFYLRFQAFRAEFGTTASIAGLATGEIFKTFAKLGASDTSVKWELLGSKLAGARGEYAEFVRHYLGDDFNPKTFMGKLFPTTYMPGSLGFYVPQEASRFRKAMFWAYRLHPWKLLTGAIDGSLFLDLWLYGSRGGTLEYDKLPWYARASLKVLNSKPFRIWNKGFTVLKAMRDLPTVIATSPERLGYWVGAKIFKKAKGALK